MQFLRYTALLLVATAVSMAQTKHSWAKVHEQDEAKWAQQSGLPPWTVHQLWRKASHFANASDDDSRIQLLDASSLGRNHILLVTYAGSEYCLELTVFAHTKGYQKIWTEEQTPAGTGFCGGDAKVWAQPGTIVVSTASNSAGPDSRPGFTKYSYQWDGETYRFAGQKKMYGNSPARDK
ncbi:MAG TPA: hypothetical protein VJQ82_17325 [Terriglobales bacterium]|nr:hypothetical protein [Terriglobales bacterium]